MATQIGIVGCGYVADYYLATLPNHPNLELVGVTDRDGERVRRFASYHSVPSYHSLDQLLAHPSIDIVVNLTNPRSHFEVTKSCLEAGKHVYTEKPLAMALPEAQELVDLAEERGLYLASAPCSILGESAQTVWAALRRHEIGPVRLVYAELDDGLIHRMPYQKWLSGSGNPWPYKDEFEVGCTLEHAGYYLTWLVAFFGPAKTVTSYALCLIPNKIAAAVDNYAPDFSVAIIEFVSGVVVRLTCSIIARHNHSLAIIGDDGVLSLHECWNYGSPVYIQRRTPLALKMEKHPSLESMLRLGPKRYPHVRKAKFRGKLSNKMDFSRGVAELAAAITEGRPCRLSASYALHVIEIVLTMQNPREMGCPRTITSSFDPVEPMPWAST